MNDKVPFSENTLTVTEINARIAACFDSPFFNFIEVFGEVSGFKMSGAHAYFTLKDKQSQISCACFNASRTYRPKDGESVVARGGIDYYTKGGRLTFIVRDMQPAGQGLLFLEFERLKTKLAGEGLFDEAHKKAIPRYPKRVLVVTSKTGAVIRDIVTTVRRKNPVIDIVVKDVRVQGDGAACEICGALEKADKLNFDVIIIARGGGSLEDLAPFYDEKLARTIYNLQTPVISAVGHETDFSLADFVADMRAPTPTAAGEAVAYDYYALVDAVKDIDRRLVFLSKRILSQKILKTRIETQKLKSVAASFYERRANNVKSLSQSMRNAVIRKFEGANYRFKNAVGALDNLSPLKILGRGFFKMQSNGRFVSEVSKLNIGDEITAWGIDGKAKAQVREIIPDKKLNNGGESPLAEISEA